MKPLNILKQEAVNFAASGGAVKADLVSILGGFSYGGGKDESSPS